MKGRRASVEELLNKLGDGSTSGPFFRQCIDLFLTGNLSGNEKPEESFWEGFRASRSFRKKLLTFWDGLSTKTNPLL
jgi:hypothetical protein